MTYPLVNDLVDLPDGTRQRILAITGEGEHAWLILMDEPRALPHREGYAWVCKHAKVAKPKAKDAVAKSLTASATALARRDEAWKRIAPLVADAGIFEPARRAKLLCQRSLEVGCSQNTLLLQLRRYWQRGQTLDALLPDYANCGTTPGVARGRRFNSGRVPYALTNEDKAAFDRAIKRHYLKQEYYKLTDSYQWMLERDYTFTDGNGVAFIKPEEERPTVKQLRLWLQKHYSLEYQLRSRKGDKDFERDHRHKLGSIQLDCHGAGHLYEIDATIVDTYLVSSKDPTAVVGKPTLYLIIDRATRLIVGWYVGFENACWMAAMQAIQSIADDKAEVCKRYGVKYDPADWPADGIQPEQFLADQGEMASKNARQISPGLRSTVSNVPGLRPDWKPLVECGFKMTHAVISPDLPAYDPPSNQTRRRGKKYHGAASLNLEQFTSLILKAIITHNRSMQVNFEPSIDQVANGVRPIPTELWTYEARARVGALARFDADAVRMELLPRESVSVTEHGVEVADCLYTFAEAEKCGWFVRARRKRFKVVVSRDYRLCDKVIVHDPFTPGRLYEAKLVKGDEKRFAGMSFAEVRRFVKANETLTAGAEQLRRQNHFEYHQHSQPIIAAADKTLKAATGGKPVSRRYRRKDTKQARGVELGNERMRTAGVPTLTPVLPMTAPPPPRVLPPPMPQMPATPVATSAVVANRPLSLAEKAALQRKKLMAAV